MRKEKGKLPPSVFLPTACVYRLLDSVFEGRKPTLFFQYPEYVNKERKSQRIKVIKREEHE
jgi:hypothetical protein